MQTTTLSFENLHNHGELFANMLRARRERFIEHNKWDLPEALGMEYDQYDTPASRWVVVHDSLGQVLAGARLTPSTARCGIYSYMIRDAQRGLLDSIPADLLFDEAPVAETIWEASRLFVADTVPAAQRGVVHRQLVFELGAAARNHGATLGLAIGSIALPRAVKAVGLEMSPAGPETLIDGKRYRVFWLHFASNLH